MSKISKIIISIIGILFGAFIIAGTIYYAYLNNSNLDNAFMNNNELMKMPNKGSEQNDMMPPSNDSNGNVNNGGRQKPNMNNNENGEVEDSTNTKRKDNTENSDINGEQPPEMPSDDNMPNDNGNRNMQDRRQGGIGKEKNNFNKPSISLSTIQIVIISIGTLILTISIMYLIMSGFGSNNIFISKDKILIFVLLNIVVSAILTFGIVLISNNKILNSGVNNIVAVNDINGEVNVNTSVSLDEDYF